MKFPKLNTQAQQREAVVQGRCLPPIPASVYLFFADFKLGDQLLYIFFRRQL
ncbi:MAG: hypothetical protein LBJ00_08340 [Planctomycetaceae bacterium]|nr:hypothetical protein [Planctomycetaceae bacterium]